MADRGKFWSAIPDWQNVAIDRAGLHIAPGEFAGRIWLVSGTLAESPEILGPRDRCDGIGYALRLAPDRTLFVGDAPESLSEMPSLGWHPVGFAASDVSDGFVLLDLTGPKAEEVMALGALYDWNSTEKLSRESAMMLFAGMKTAIVRLESGWRLHIERPLAPALWRWLENI